MFLIKKLMAKLTGNCLKYDLTIFENFPNLAYESSISCMLNEGGGQKYFSAILHIERCVPTN